MSRRRNKHHKQHGLGDKSKPSSTGDHVLQYVKGTIGMISVKTIRTRDGKVILRQGERIREEILTEFSQDEILEQILANAMPGRKSDFNQ